MRETPAKKTQRQSCYSCFRFHHCFLAGTNPLSQHVHRRLSSSGCSLLDSSFQHSHCNRLIEGEASQISTMENLSRLQV
ncbi:hypothetical protein LWI28_019305 [Acer negundo]|uniref:Uncharacterized protein n=1 Tax=Acer negundo TaxID=4023 RepID=A0AAD5NRU9_ACENE|nr:hypothetical protein LWI28_019305 [Acer negundo]